MVFVNFTFFWETLTKPVGFADPSDCERSELLSEGDGARREVSAHLLRSSPFSSQTRSLFSAAPDAAALGTGFSLHCGRDRELARRGSAPRLAGH